MKKLFFLLAAAAAVCACSKEEGQTPATAAKESGVRTLEISTGDSRVAVGIDRINGDEFTWKAGDKVYLCRVDDVDGTAFSGNNYTFILDAGSEGQASGSFTMEGEGSLLEGKYVAVHTRIPVSITAGKDLILPAAGSKVINLNPPVPQTQSTGCNNVEDIMYLGSAPFNVVSGQTVPQVTFRHLTAIVELRITAASGNGFDGARLASAEMKSSVSTEYAGRLGVDTNGDAKNAGSGTARNTITVNLADHASAYVGSSSPTYVRMMVMMNSAAASGTTTFTLVADKEGTSYVYTKTVNSKFLTAGKVHPVPITVDTPVAGTFIYNAATDNVDWQPDATQPVKIVRCEFLKRSSGVTVEERYIFTKGVALAGGAQTIRLWFATKKGVTVSGINFKVKDGSDGYVTGFNTAEVIAAFGTGSSLKGGTSSNAYDVNVSYFKDVAYNTDYKLNYAELNLANGSVLTNDGEHSVNIAIVAGNNPAIPVPAAGYLTCPVSIKCQ